MTTWRDSPWRPAFRVLEGEHKGEILWSNDAPTHFFIPLPPDVAEAINAGKEWLGYGFWHRPTGLFYTRDEIVRFLDYKPEAVCATSMIPGAGAEMRERLAKLPPGNSDARRWRTC